MKASELIKAIVDYPEWEVSIETSWASCRIREDNIRYEILDREIVITIKDDQ